MKRFKIGAALLAASALVLAGCGGPSDSDTTNNGDANLGYDAGNCRVFDVWSSPEKAAAMADFAQAFKQQSEQQNPDNCYAPQVVVVSSGDAAKYLNDISKTPSTKPLPALWSPASSIWVDDVETNATDIVGEWASFAKSPVVLAMPEPMARAIGWPSKDFGMKDLRELCLSGWSSLGGAAATWGDFKLFKTNPNPSTTGLNVVLQQVYAHAGKTDGLTVSDVKAANSFSADIETCAPHYGSTTGDVLERISKLNSLAYASGVFVEEKSVIDFNLGNPKGKSDVDPATLTPPSTKMVAVYLSSGSLVSDNPAVVIDTGASWVTPEDRAGAQQFAAYLQTDAVQDSLDDYGFRPLDASKPLAGMFTANNGVNAQQKITYLEKPSNDVTTAAKNQWEQNRKPSNVMILLDGSGSMNDRVSGATFSYIGGAQSAALVSIGLLRPTDRLAINVFADESMVQVRAMAALGGDANLSDTINGIAAAGGTPLYDSVWATYQQMQAQAEPGRINAIVLLSDGKNENPGGAIKSMKALAEKISGSIGEHGANKAGQVMIFPMSYGKNAPIEDLRMLAEVTGGQVIDATDASLIEDKMVEAFRNF